MNRAQLWSSLQAHPLSGWMNPKPMALPELAPQSRLLWCGIGGSVLPAQAILRALGPSATRTAFVPLQSPEPMALHLESSDQLVLASKSGGTLELWTWIGRLRTLRGLAHLHRPPLVITQPDGNPLHRFAEAEGYPVLPFPSDTGGRFSAFTPIGTLALRWMGGDAEAFLQGGREAVRQADAGEGPLGPVPKPPRAALGAPGGSPQERRDEHSGSTRFEPDAAGDCPPPQPGGTMSGGRSAASAPLAHEPHGPAGPSLRSIPPDVVAARGGFGTGPWGHRIWGAVSLLRESYLQGLQSWAHLPYCQRLDRLGAWWVQLVAESLGKVAKDGTRRAIDPIRGQGPMDQHAQLQRWLGGPRQVGVFAITVGNGGTPETLDLPLQCPFPTLSKWRGSEILQAQAEGTLEALQAAGVPTLHWHLDRLDEATLGAHLMSWQLIVALLGLSLELDPFDQPEVEAGKKRTLVKLQK